MKNCETFGHFQLETQLKFRYVYNLIIIQSILYFDAFDYFRICHELNYILYQPKFTILSRKKVLDRVKNNYDVFFR